MIKFSPYSCRKNLWAIYYPVMLIERTEITRLGLGARWILVVARNAEPEPGRSHGLF
jgi:hypothetical protein